MSTTNKYPTGLRNVFRLHAAGVVLGALPMVLVPVTWAELVGLGAVDVTLTRLLGASLLATAVGSFLASRVETYREVRTYLLFELTIGALLVLVAGYEVLLNGAAPFVWSLVAIPGLFNLARTYYLLQEEGSPTGTAHPTA